jgi:biopolymer transport protein ExbB
MLFNSLTELFEKGGYTLLLLVICSIISLKVIIEKLVAYKVISERSLDETKYKIFSSVDSNELKEAVMLCKLSVSKFLTRTIKSPLASVFQFIIENRKLPKDELLDGAYVRLDKEIVKFEKGLGILATLGAVSPFIGLFGTVLGIIKSFQALSLSESSGYLNVMNGIAESLISTAAGLVVAIPAVMFYNYFTKKMKNTMPSFEEAIKELIRKLKYSEKDTAYAKIQE